MHRVKDGKADWENIPREEWNPAQKIAAATHGIITPANALDAASLVANTIINEKMIIGGHKQMLEAADANDKSAFRAGATKKMAGLAIGLPISTLTDLFDGMLADKTGTKSPIGEAADAGNDAIRAVEILETLLRTGDISKAEALVIGGPKILNGAAMANEKLRGREFHSSFGAKAAEAARDAFVGARYAETVLKLKNALKDADKYSLKHLMSREYKPDSKVYRIAHTVGNVALVGAGVAGFAVSIGSIKQSFFVKSAPDHPEA